MSRVLIHADTLAAALFNLAKMLRTAERAPRSTILEAPTLTEAGRPAGKVKIQLTVSGQAFDRKGEALPLYVMSGPLPEPDAEARP